MKKTRYAAVGTGGRIRMFIDPIAGRFRDSSELVGLCDPSEVRRTFHQLRLAREYGIGPVPAYEDFDRMLREQRPDTVIICTPDYLHHEYIVKSLEFGADVISEKPLTIDANKCGEIFAAVEKTGRKVRTTFNMRWSPGVSKVRELIAAGAIGEVKHVNFEDMLNTAHGADYFRRWHSQKQCSGGLLLHKSTHHFDVLNWWIDGIPSLVFALGGLVFYGRENALRRGDAAWTEYPRYAGAAAAEKDPFFLDMKTNPTMRSLYLDAEEESGYIRDRNVFRDGIDIEDSLSLLIRYREGTMATYSLNAYCPREGFRASISGDRGRIDYEEEHGSHIITREGEGPVSDDFAVRLRVQKHFSPAYEVEIPRLEGNHCGADPLLQEQIFSGNPPPDPQGRHAGHEQGAASLLVGAAGNISLTTGQPVTLDSLLRLRPEAKRLSQLI